MNEAETATCERLLDKSQEAFLLAIELYNRPTIRYHAEGCCFFCATPGNSCLRRM